MRFRLVAIASMLACLAAAPYAHAQIVLNEILPDPAGTDDGTERIEIYNKGTTTIDVTGWGIEDAATIDTPGGAAGQIRCRMPEDFLGPCPTSAQIGPGEFRVLKGITAPAFLNNGGDDIYIVSSRTIYPAPVAHFVSYPTAAGHIGEVWAPQPNGDEENYAWRMATLCASNGGDDETAPGTVPDLVAVPGIRPGEVRLTWTATGDDGASGTATGYEIKVAYAPITSGTFGSAADLDRWINEPVPHVAGAAETLFVFGLSPDTTYHFALRAFDEFPNTGPLSNSASSAPLGGPLLDPDLGYSFYYGNLHSHTGYSDGVQTPADAYAFAATQAPTPLDFLAVTDHNHSGAGMSLPSYALGLAQADTANVDGQFVAIYGQEWGIGEEGHVGIFQPPVLFGWEPGNYDVFVAQGDYAGLYAAVVANPPAQSPPLASFCHPAQGDFDDYLVTPQALAVVRLMCLVNGPAFSTSTTESEIGNTGFDAPFQNALIKGFRVSPTGDQDNHYATWGAATESRTVALASAKTRGAILGALAAGRNYATQDHNVRIDFSADGHAMGEAFTRGAGVEIAVRVTDPDPGERATRIEVFRGITGDTAVAHVVGWSTNNGTFHWRERQSFPAGTEAHYYVRVRMADNQTSWTGPVFVTYDPSAPVAVDPPVATSAGVALAAPRPNPARGRVALAFTLARSEARARLAVYDLAGRPVRTLVDGALTAGDHAVAWDGTDARGARVAAGMYFVRLEAGGTSAGRKLILAE